MATVKAGLHVNLKPVLETYCFKDRETKILDNMPKHSIDGTN